MCNRVHPADLVTWWPSHIVTLPGRMPVPLHMLTACGGKIALFSNRRAESMLGTNACCCKACLEACPAHCYRSCQPQNTCTPFTQIQMPKYAYSFPAPQKLSLSSNELTGSFPANWTLPRSLQVFRIWCGNFCARRRLLVLHLQAVLVCSLHWPFGRAAIAGQCGTLLRSAGMTTFHARLAQPVAEQGQQAAGHVTC